MATWADLAIAAKKNELIRKTLDAEVYLAPIATTLPTTIIDTDNVSPKLPTGFKPLGHHTDDGLRWGREVETADLTSLGSAEPSRSDVRRVNRTVAVTAQETNRLAIEAAFGIDLAAVTPPLSGEVVFTESNRPKSIYYRLLAIGVDDSDAGEIYIGRLFPRAKVTDVGEETWSDGEGGLVRDMTFTAYRDDTAGFPVKHFFGGPGWKALLTKMGFPAAATV